MHHFQVPAFFWVAHSPFSLTNSRLFPFLFKRVNRCEAEHERWRHQEALLCRPQVVIACGISACHSLTRGQNTCFFLDQNQTSALACSSHYPSHSGAVFAVVDRYAPLFGQLWWFCFLPYLEGLLCLNFRTLENSKEPVRLRVLYPFSERI